jgi:hypothetical protein
VTVETRNPLPAGRYWIDVSNEPVPLGTWQGFVSAFKDFVHIESTVDDGVHSWFLFTTSKPLVWPEGIGFPTVAGPEIRSRADTVQRPDPVPDFLDSLPSARDIASGIGNAVTIGAAGLAVLIFFMTVRRKT